MTQVFRLNLKTGNNNNEDYVKKVFNHCLENQYIGIGWPIKDEHENVITISTDKLMDYIKDNSYSKYKDDKGFKKAYKALNSIKKDDLIWIHSPDGVYYLCRAKEKFMINEHYDENYDLYGIVNCYILKIGTMETIPAAVRNSFIPRAALQRVTSNYALEYSCILFNNALKTKNKIDYDIQPYKIENKKLLILDFLESELIEEVVSLYLQKNKGYFIYSSTNKISTQAYEFVAISKDGNKVYTQVKTGGETVDINLYQHILNDKNSILYIYDGKEDNYKRNNVIKIQSKVLEKFIKENLIIMPDIIKEIYNILICNQ